MPSMVICQHWWKYDKWQFSEWDQQLVIRNLGAFLDANLSMWSICTSFANYGSYGTTTQGCCAAHSLVYLNARGLLQFNPCGPLRVLHQLQSVLNCVTLGVANNIVIQTYAKDTTLRASSCGHVRQLSASPWHTASVPGSCQSGQQLLHSASCGDIHGVVLKPVMPSHVSNHPPGSLYILLHLALEMLYMYV